jgi:hypothetical protein
VTGVQTCALPILNGNYSREDLRNHLSLLIAEKDVVYVPKNKR